MISKKNLLRTIERERERHATIEARLIDQLLHLTGKPWTPSPASETVPAEPERIPPGERFTASPEQHVVV